MKKGKDPRLFWIGLSSIPGVGKATFRKLVTQFGSPERALAASANELEAVEGLPRKVVEALLAFPGTTDAEQELEKVSTTGASLITMDDADYPVNLREIPDPPLYLYVIGSLKHQDRNAVAIVGTRKPTYYGKSVTRRLAGELAASGITVVSGMARGIDTEAHRGALQNSGRTIAVLGCGLDTAYPPENGPLMQEIAKTGAVVTEYAFGTKPEPGYFPARNRIISGLARGTVIIEASADSGSLITARYALEQKRRLFAVPGNIGSAVSRGANSLIKQGAALVENTDDILKGLNHPGRALSERAARSLPTLTPEETAVLRTLTNEPKHIDLLMNENAMSPGAMSGVLITLELKGLARQLPGKFFVREQ
jgi:DNA processing protein